MTESEKIFDAFRNCVTVPKCRDCPWDGCDTLNNGTVDIPRDLALAVLREFALQPCEDAVSRDDALAAARKATDEFLGETNPKLCVLLTRYIDSIPSVTPKAQEPRVLTLEEVLELRFDDVVYVQLYPTNVVVSAIVLDVISQMPDGEIGIVQFRHTQEPINNADLSYYGKTWRCWTSRPTDAQREAIPW